MKTTNVSSSAEIAAVVRQRRRDVHFTQDELAAYAGVGRRFVIDLEDGKETVRLDKVLLVFKALGLRIGLSVP